MNFFAFIFLLFFSTPLLGSDFENWYFQMHLEECDITGKILSPNFEEIGTFSGTASGILSKDGNKITTLFNYKYLPKGNQEKYAFIWTQSTDGSYQGVSSGTKKFKCKCILTIEDKSYKLTTTFPDGTIVRTEGTLNREGTIESNDTARNKNGDIIGRMSYTHKSTEKG